MPVFLPSGQLSGSLCRTMEVENIFYLHGRTQVLVIRDFATCTCQHYYAIFMHSACVHVQLYMHTYALCGYTRQLRTCRYTRQPAQWHLSSCGYSRHSVPKGLKSSLMIIGCIYLCCWYASNKYCKTKVFKKRCAEYFSLKLKECHC